jgi:tetratricopeptide (TPR) repeat protein
MTKETAAQTFNAAVSHHRAGRPDEAERLCRAVLAMEPDHFGATHYLALAANRRGQRDEAEALFRRAVALRPSDVGARNNLGALLQTLGRIDEAAAELTAALRLDPDNAAVHNNLGIALAAQGHSEQAITEYEKAVALNPRYTAAQDNLGNALAALGRHPEAIAHLRRALDLVDAASTRNALSAALLTVGNHDEAAQQAHRAVALKPDFAEAHNNLGFALVALRRPEEAIAHCRRAIELKPGFAEAHNNLGNALTALKQYDDAMAHYRGAIALKPDYAEALHNLGNVLSAQHRYADAIPRFEKALALKPNFAEALGNFAMALTAVNRHDEALPYYERAIALAPGLADLHAGYGNQLMILGRLEQAQRELEQAIALEPARVEFHRRLTTMKRASTSELEAMQRLAADVDGLADNDRMDLNFALGKAHADVGDHDSASRHYVAANALKRRQVDYNEAARLGFFERIKAAFTSEAMRRLAGCGDPSPLPIFIVGMPRSGTTLVEQILASHPLVFGAGEIGELDAVITAVKTDGAQRLPEAIATMTGDEVRRIGTQYRDRLAALAPKAEPRPQRITDKLLANFLWIGLIHLALPNARIIHVRRDPVDTCLSCFTKLFAGELPFTYDLAELGRYYRAYARLMAYWRTVLPQDAMLDVQYEELVTDFPAQARRLIAYCGLEWDERCLAFHETERPVTTSSAAQVRQPLYRDSIGAWRPYKEMLRPLLNELDRP